MSWFLEFPGSGYEEVRSNFEWDLPPDYNIARDTVRKHDRDAEALRVETSTGERKPITFGTLDARSDQLANGLSALGLEQGDRVAIMLGQRPETVVVHLACWKLGLVSVPLSVLFGESALRHRLRDSRARVLVIDESVSGDVSAVEGSCPALDLVVSVGEQPRDRTYDPLESLWRDEPRAFDIVQTTPTDPAIRVYTSGTTGPATGVSHSQAVWVSYCSAFRMYFEHTEYRPENSVYWTPSDWAWIGGLGTVLFPALHYGRPVVARPIRAFDAATAYEILERFAVTHASIPPTALRFLVDADVSPSSYDLSLEVIVSGSEPLTQDVVAWTETAFEDVVLNEGYGQTETGNTVSNCQSWFDLRSGSIGKPVPGYDVEVVDQEDRDRVPPDTVGEIAVRRTGNPGVFQGGPAFSDSEGDEWHLTGDLARYDESGYLWFIGRRDDLIISSGYRIAPHEVEAVLATHDAVTAAGVVGVPDDRRGEVIAAVVTLAEGTTEGPELEDELRDLVREELSKYAYPRTVTFVDHLPTTSTGKTDTGALRDMLDDDE